MSLKNVTEKIRIEMSGSTKRYMVSAKQGDRATRYIEVTLLDNGEEYQIPAGAVVTSYVKKPDRKRVYASCQYSGAKVTVALNSQTLAAAGTALCEVEVKSSDMAQMITSVTFEIEIEPRVKEDDAIVSSDEMSFFDKIMQQYAQQENARQQAESARATAESGRATAEAGRVKAEQARVTAESARAQAEQTRTTEEGKRAAAESIRVTKENARQQAESARATAESGRVTAESGRATAESGRATAEAGRVKAEQARVTAESARAQAEQTRITEEGKRAAAESTRVTKENARQQAESARATAESGRITAESGRVSAEEERRKNAQEVLDKANQAILIASQINGSSYIEDKDANVKYAFSVYVQGGVPHMALSQIEE